MSAGPGCRSHTLRLNNNRAFIISDSGGVEDEDALQSMNLNEKKDLMRGIQQSKEASIIVSCILDLLAYR